LCWYKNKFFKIKKYYFNIYIYIYIYILNNFKIKYIPRQYYKKQLKILKFGGLYYENIDFLFCYFGPLLTTKTQKEKKIKNNNNNLTHTTPAQATGTWMPCLALKNKRRKLTCEIRNMYTLRPLVHVLCVSPSISILASSLTNLSH